MAPHGGDDEGQSATRPQFANEQTNKEWLVRDAAAPYGLDPVPGGYRLTINLLLAPGSDPEEAIERLLPEWAVHGVSLTIGEPEGASQGSQSDHPLFEAAAAVLTEAYPESTVGPYFPPYNLTDARFFRAHGIPAFGYSPFLFFSMDSIRADRINERVSMPGFLSGVELYKQAVRDLVLEDSG